MADEPVSHPVVISVDPALEAAAMWRGLSPAAYVQAVIAEAVEADTALARFARESVDPDAAASQEALEAWFEARREDPRD